MFDFGIEGIYSEYHNLSFMRCGCVWQGPDHRNGNSTNCPESPHPTARVTNGPRVVARGDDYGHMALVNRSKGEYINRMIRMEPAIAAMERGLKGNFNRITPFIKEAILHWCRNQFDLRIEEANDAFIIVAEQRNKKKGKE